MDDFLNIAECGLSFEDFVAYRLEIDATPITQDGVPVSDEVLFDAYEYMCSGIAIDLACGISFEDFQAKVFERNIFVPEADLQLAYDEYILLCPASLSKDNGMIKKVAIGAAALLIGWKLLGSKKA